MKKVVCVLSAILFTLGSFANVGLASTKLDDGFINVEILSSEWIDGDFDSWYTITQYRTCWTDNLGTFCWEDYDIDEVPCQINQQ